MPSSPTSLSDHVYAILAYAYKIQMNSRPEQCSSIFSDSQLALKALQAAKTPSPLVQRHQKASNDISTHQSVRLFWVPRHPGIHGYDSGDELAMEGSVHQFVWSEPALGFWSQNINKNIKCCLDN